MFDEMSKAWKKFDNATKVGMVILILLLVTSIIALVYLLWQTIFFIGLVIAYVVYTHYEQKKKLEAQRLQMIANHRRNATYALRHGLDGLEGNLGLPDKKSKGLRRVVVRYYKDGVLYLDLYYLRLPNLPDLIQEECEQYKEILNAELQGNDEDITDENIVPFCVYVPKLQTKDGKLAIRVIPLVDNNSRAKAELYGYVNAENAIIGRTEADTTKENNHKELLDDEL